MGTRLTSKDLYKQIREASPILQSQAGYHTNAMEDIVGYLSIPKQVMYQIGKNIGEFALQNEIGDDSFFTDLKNAMTGKSNLSFNSVLRSVNLDDLDVALPKEVLIENDFGRWSASVASGIASTFVGGPVAGLTVGFAANDALQGKGVVSSVADIALDPLNKLRILPKTAKGLGVSDDVIKKLSSEGRLEDFVTRGFAYVPKKGSTKVADNLFEITLHGDIGNLERIIPAGLKAVTKISPTKAVAVLDDAGLEIARQNAQNLSMSTFKQIQKKGQFLADDLERIDINKTQSSLLGSLLKGERKLFDFKGNSGFVLTPTSPVFGKFLVPTGLRSVDVGNATGANIIAKVMDLTNDGLGAAFLKVPGVNKLAQFEEKYVAPITGAIGKTIAKPFKSLLQVGGDFALKSRSTVENILSDNKHPAYGPTLELIQKYPGNTLTEKLASFEDTARKLKETNISNVSNLDKEADILKMNAFNIIRNITISNLGQTVKNVGGADVIKALEDGFIRKANLTPLELQNLDVLNPENTQKFIDAFNTSTEIKEDVGKFLLSDAIGQEIENIKSAKNIKDLMKAINPQFLNGVESQLDDVVVPFNQKLNIQILPEEMAQTLKASRSQGSEELNLYLKKTSEVYDSLVSKEAELQNSLQQFDNTNTKVLNAKQGQVQRELLEVKNRILTHLEDEKTLIKFLKDPSIYEKSVEDLQKIANRIDEVKGLYSASEKSVSQLEKRIGNRVKGIESLAKELEQFPKDNLSIFKRTSATLKDLKALKEKEIQLFKRQKSEKLEINKLNKEIDSLEEKIRHKSEQIRVTDIGKQNQSTVLKSLYANKQDKNTRLYNLLKSKPQTEAEKIAVKKQISELQKEIKNNAELKKGSSSQVKLQNELNDLKNKKAQLQKSLDAQKTKSKLTQDSLKVEEGKLSQEWERLKGKIASDIEDPVMLKRFLQNSKIYYKDALNKAYTKEEQLAKIEGFNTIDGEKVGKLGKELESTRQDLRVAEKLNASLEKVLKLRGKDKLDFSLLTPEVRNIYSKTLELLGDNFNRKFKITFDNAKALGKVTEFDFAVAQVVKGFNADKTQTLVLRLAQTADVLDASNLMGRTIFEFLDDATKTKIAGLLGETDVTKLEKKFTEIFSTGMLNPQPLLDNLSREASGFFGKLHDSLRKVLAYIGEIFQIPSYKNEAIRTKLFEYIKGGDLNIEKKSLVGDELIGVSTLLDKSGNIVDPVGLRALLNRTYDALQKSGLVAVSGGIDTYLDGVSFSALVLNNKESYQEMVQRSRALSVDIANRGQIGEKELIAWQRMFKDNPDLSKLVVEELEIVPQKLMEEFLTVKDFTGMANPSAVIYSTIIRIASAFDVIPYEVFNNEFGLLYRQQLNLLKSLESMPIADFIKQHFSYDLLENAITKENRQIRTVFSRFSLTSSAFGGDGTSNLIENPVYRETLGQLSAYLNNVPNNQFSERLRNIREILRKRVVSPAQFSQLKDSIVDLGKTGDPQELGIVKQLDAFLTDFIETQANELSRAEIAIHNTIKDPVVAEELIKVMRTRLNALDNPEQFGGALGGQVKAVLERDTNGRQAFLNIADELGATQKAQFSALEGRKATGILNSDGAISKLRGFQPFILDKKEGNPLLRVFENQLVPDSLMKVLKGDFGEPVAQLSETRKMWMDWVYGIGEEEGKRRGQKTVNFINKLMPDWAKLGDRAEEAFNDFYTNLNYDYFLNLFKAHALLSPAFHARNIYSGIYVNTTHGVNANSHKEALEASYFKRSKDYNPSKWIVDQKTGEIRFTDFSLTEKQRNSVILLSEAQKSGVIGSGAVSELIKNDLSNRGWTSLFGLDAAPLRMNRAIAEFSEDVLRMASFKHARETLNYSIEDSADFVKMLHFDYNLLTEFEKQKLKRIIPFYTYMRKAVARDSRLFMERTGDFYRVSALAHKAEEGTPPEKDEEVNKFIQNKMGVNVKVGPDGKYYYLLLGGTIPASDLALQIKNLTEKSKVRPSEALRKVAVEFASNLVPYIKVPLESILNYDFYFDKPIKQIQGENAWMFGQTMSKEQAWYIQQVRWLNDLDKIYRIALDAKNPLRPDLPAPSELDFGRTRQALQVLGGIDIRDNSKPKDNYFYNSVLPRKQEQARLYSEINRQTKIGNTPNLKNAVEQYKHFIKRETDKFFIKNEANKQIFRQIEGKK